MIELNNKQKIIISIILTVILFVIFLYVWNITTGGSDGIEIIEESKFCSFCGNEINNGKKCSNCGSNMKDDEKFCHSCGNKVN